MRIALLLVISIFAATPANADPRIRDVVFAEDKVIRLVGHYGYQIAIEFPAPARIESVAIGDSLTWQATPNKRGNILFIKPVDEGDPTNMTVVTTERHYSFELIAKRRTAETPASEITFHLRVLPPPPAAIAPPPAPSEPVALRERAPVNTRYTYKGSRENLPSRVFDDGVSTTFEWPRGVETPAIFYRRPDGGESIVNFSYKDGAIVVHQVAPQFILRNGREVTEIFNDGFVEVERGPDAPRPRAGKKKGGLFGLFGE